MTDEEIRAARIKDQDAAWASGYTAGASGEVKIPPTGIGWVTLWYKAYDRAIEDRQRKARDT